MSESNEMKFLNIHNAILYNYEEALKRLNLRQEDVDRLREKVKSSKDVPKFITDKQVKQVYFFIYSGS